MTSIPKDERPSCTGADGFPSSLTAFADQYRLIERQMKDHLHSGRPPARLDAARMRLHEIVILRMKTWLPAETLERLRQAEGWRRGEVRVRHHIMKRFREDIQI
jgi:hypothetical protein